MRHCRRAFDFALGARYESNKASDVLRTDRDAAWSFDATLLEWSVATPLISSGTWTIEPTLRIAGGNADFALTDRTATLFEADGTLASIGMGLTAKPCPGCRTYVVADFAYAAALDTGGAFAGADGEVALNHFHSREVSVRLGRRVFDDRIGLNAGARWNHADAELSVMVEGHPVPVPGLRYDRVEPVGGFDFKIGPWFDIDVRFSPDYFFVDFSWDFVRDILWFDSECGGPGDATCAAPRFCNFPMTATCGTNGNRGTCIERPKKCPSNTDWVCGCDGKNYANACLAEMAGVSVANNERCPQPRDPCEKGTDEIANGGFEIGSIAAWNIDDGAVVLSKEGLDFAEKNDKHPTEQLITVASPLMRLQGRPIKPYCGTTMLRVNDLEGGQHATRVWQTFDLPSTISACSYIRVHWGAMLHDGNHDPTDQPFFEIELLRNGTVISRERFSATDAQKNGWTDIRSAGEKEPVWYRHGEATASLAKAQTNDHIEIRMTAADCTQGHHGGAAFIDCVEIVDHCKTTCAFRGRGSLDSVIVPNVFSPNGDDINDIWAITAVPACRVMGKIYNQWGVLMAEPTWESEYGAPWEGYIELWNGKAKNGLDASEGTYYYILKVTNCYETRDFIGFFHLLRSKAK